MKWHWAYMQLLDSALPIGSFAHSFGLETAAQFGTVQSKDDVKRYIRAMLWSAWAPTDALAVKAVYEYAPRGDWEAVWNIDRLQHVSRAASETREGVVKIGRRLLKLAEAMHPELGWEPLRGAVREGVCPGTHPTVHGYVAYRLGVPLDEAAMGYLYACSTMAVNTALRLLSMGQTEAQSLLASLLPELERAWERVKPLPPESFYANAPVMELYMMNHEILYSRLFMS